MSIPPGPRPGWSQAPNLGSVTTGFGSSLVSGYWSDTGYLGELLAKYPAERNMEIMPKGARWPWYPIYLGKAVLDASPTHHGEHEVGFDLSFHWTESPHIARVGFRRWVRYLLGARKRKNEVVDE